MASWQPRQVLEENRCLKEVIHPPRSRKWGRKRVPFPVRGRLQLTAERECLNAIPWDFSFIPFFSLHFLKFFSLKCKTVFKIFYHSNRFVVISHCCLNLHFLNDKYYWQLSHMFICHWYIFISELSVQIFWPYFNWTFVFDCWNLSSLYILKKPFAWLTMQIFSPSL